MQIFNKTKFIGGKFTGPLQLVQQSWGISKESFKKGVPVLGGLGGLALALGHTALAGFVTGAIAGGTAGAIGGAILGAKIGAAVGTLVGGPVGAVIGGIAGGIAGGVAGFFIGAIGGGLAGMGIALSGEQLLKGAGNFVTSAASGLWNGVTAFAGNVLSGAGSFLSNVIGALGTATVPTAAIGIPVATALTVTVGMTIINNINTSTAFLDLEAATSDNIPPENQFLTITKTASPTRISNDEATNGKEIKFTISLTTKEQSLTNVTINNNSTISPAGKPAFGDFEKDKDGNDISIFNIGDMKSKENKTIAYTILVNGDKYHNSNIADTARVNFKTNDSTGAVSDSASVTVGEIPHCTSASDGNPVNGIETSPQELECYIVRAASGKIEPKSGHDLPSVMIRVMRAESGGNQCAAGTAGEIGVFQYIASTWRGSWMSQPGADSGSGTIPQYRSGRSTCWGLPGEDPKPVPPYDDPKWGDVFKWDIQCGGANRDCGAWNPFAQIDNTILKMEAGGACIWTTYKNFYPDKCS